MSGLFSLAGRTALITGAGGGIGSATARMFAAAGASVVLSDQNVESCAALASELAAVGADATTLPADLTDQAMVRAMAEQSLALGPIDILVCNGAIEGHVGPIGEASDVASDRLLAVNLRSAMTLASVLAPAMASRKRGSIVLVASIAGVRGNKAIGLYGLSKAGLIQLARNLAVEWGPHGVRANSISPGLIRTLFARPILDDEDYLGGGLA